MNLRALSFLVLFTTQALAGGVAGVLHLCSQATLVDTCSCPHGKKADAPLSWRAVDCCETQALKVERVPGTPELSRQQVAPAQVAVLAPTWMVPVAAHSLPRPAFAGEVAPPGQGPPIFLKVRSLLN